MKNRWDELYGRWDTEDGKRRLSAVLAAAKRGEKWEAILAGFSYADEVENGRDLRYASCEKADLQGADLSQGDLSHSFWYGTNLECADLTGANLHRAHIHKQEFTLSGGGREILDANLNHAVLRNANLSGADFHEAILTAADFRGSNLSEGNFLGANLQGADLRETILSCASFAGADLSDSSAVGADFSGLTLSHGSISYMDSQVDYPAAKLCRARCRGAKFADADLAGVDFSNASLRDADFSHANLRCARFVGADLRGTRLDKVTLYNSDEWGQVAFDTAIFNRRTSFINTAIARNNWDGNPLLRRQVEDQQWLYAWRRSSRTNGFLYWIWFITCDCGRSVLLWAAWCTFVAAVFGYVFWCFGDSFRLSSGDSLTLRDAHPWTAFYYSIVTFTTLGFGDVTPLHTATWMQALVALEVVLGYLGLGGLISILATKLARRA